MLDGLVTLRAVPLLRMLKILFYGIADLLKGQEKTPLVLCGVEYELALYKRVNTWQNTAPEGVRGAPNGFKGGEMHTRAMECLEQLGNQELETVLAQYDKQAGEVATSGVNDLVKAAYEGRIMHLFVAENAQAMGNFDEASHRAGGQRRLHVLPAIERIAGPGDEGVARLHEAAVGAQRAAHPRRQPARGRLGGLQARERHQKLSTSAGPGAATMPGLNSMSGATPIERRLCCTTWLNTGAAISPP